MRPTIFVLIAATLACGGKKEQQPDQKPTETPPSDRAKAQVPVQIDGVYDLAAAVPAATGSVATDVVTTWVIVTADAVHAGRLVAGKPEGAFPGEKLALPDLPARLDALAKSELKKDEQKPAEDPPPPPEPKPDEAEEEGSGPAERMELDEGKMGRRERDRRPYDEEPVEVRRAPSDERGAGAFVRGKPKAGATLVLCDRAVTAERLAWALARVPNAQLAVRVGEAATASTFALPWSGPGEPSYGPGYGETWVILDDEGYQVAIDRELVGIPRAGNSLDRDRLKKALGTKAERTNARPVITLSVRGNASAGEMVDTLALLLELGERNIRVAARPEPDPPPPPQPELDDFVEELPDEGEAGGGGGPGTGYGVGAPSRNPNPKIRIGAPTVTGGLAKDVIRKVIRRRMNNVEYCYRRQLTRTPDLKGTVKVEIVVGADGAVASAKVVQGIHADVDACITGVMSSLAFPKPDGGGIVKIIYPFKLEPGDPPQ
jgi:hypothetical protein